MKYKEITTDSIYVNPESQTKEMNITIKSDTLGFVTIIFGNKYSLRIPKKEAENLSSALLKGSCIANNLVEHFGTKSDHDNHMLSSEVSILPVYPGHNPSCQWKKPFDDPKDW